MKAPPPPGRGWGRGDREEVEINKYTARFEELESQMARIESTKHHRASSKFPNAEYVDDSLFNKWRIEVKNLLSMTCGIDSVHYQEFISTEKSVGFYTHHTLFDRLKPVFLAAKGDYLGGFMESLVQVDTVSHATANTDNLFVKDKVFIVHGHDNEMKLEVARFLEKLNINPVILHEQANAGKTIIEKFEKFSEVGYAIVLYSPCDVGKEKFGKGKLQSRARQNVVFEHGYLLGKLGRDKVTALIKPNIEKPSDTDGVVYIEYDAGNWKILMATELQNAGFNVDLNLLKGR